MHVMIDIETWGRDYDAQLRSVALVPFDPLERDSFGDLLAKAKYANVADYETRQYTFRRDTDVERWWAEQGARAQAAFKEPAPISPYAACEAIASWFAAMRPVCVWAKSPTFDCVILNYHFDCFQLERPWSFRSERDVRTIQQWYQLSDVRPEGMITHRADHDAAAQAMLIQKAWNIR